MKTITAIWKDGRIQPDEKADWPDGCRLRIEPLDQAAGIGMREEDWSNSPESVAAWLQWYQALEPLEFTAQEEAGLAEWREKVKQASIVKMSRNVEGLFP